MTPLERLTARLDELAASVHRAGVPADQAARLLELSALATMKAVELELLTSGRATQVAAPVAPAQAAAPLLVAAAA
jgi:hypothetical protein